MTPRRSSLLSPRPTAAIPSTSIFEERTTTEWKWKKRKTRTRMRVLLSWLTAANSPWFLSCTWFWWWHEWSRRADELKLDHSKKEGDRKPYFSGTELACRQLQLGANAAVTRCLRRVLLRSGSIKLASTDVRTQFHCPKLYSYPHSASFLQLSFDQHFSLCFLNFELLCQTISSPSDFSFKAKEQLFEQKFCHLIFPVRGKSIFDSLWKISSPVSTSEMEFTRCRSRRGKQSCTQWSCLVSSQGMIAWHDGWSNRKRGSGVSVLFSFVSVDSCSSTGERKTGSATWDWQ